MFRPGFACKSALCLALSALASVLPVNSGDLHSGLSDASKRQIAYVMPPAPVAPSPASGVPVSPSAANPLMSGFRLPAPAWFNAKFGSDSRAAHTAQALPSLPVPRQLEDAADKTVVAIQSVTRIATKRLADLLTWIGMLVQSQNDPPKATPAQAFLTPQAPAQDMHPIADPGKGTQLVLTSEHRLRTVVGR